MNLKELQKIFEKHGRRTLIIGSEDFGVLVALDMEGRLFTVVEGQVVSRVDEMAIGGESTAGKYFNPGGDVLWPAPEGTRHGFQYSRGNWNVPVGIRLGKYHVKEHESLTATIYMEVDLINNEGVGLPTVFEREISILADKVNTVNTLEKIRYCGTRSIKRGSELLAPWSLAQFSCNGGCKVVFPYTQNEEVWSLYNEDLPSSIQFENKICQLETDGKNRYQIGIDRSVPWIEYQDPIKDWKIRRQSKAISEGYNYIDIRDVDANEFPDKKGVRYSVYNDAGGFMEMEAVGGMPDTLTPGTEMILDVNTSYSRLRI